MQQDEWIPLFDGVSTQGWHNVGRDTLDSRWQAIDGTLALTAGGGGDIATDAEYGDFELELEWQVSPGGNSGIFYRAADRVPVWRTAPEMQVLDDAAAEDRHDPKHRAGSVYDVYAPSQPSARPAGEFNQMRIVARGGRVEHWLNGKLAARYDLDSDDWKRRVAASKFAAYPDFAVSRRGHIALQDHGDPVRFRNIRIRPLD
ncbi:DUF1080 domain-containing protein [Luteimonas sp. SX5]|uniref:DUF1080 domain-containing protein n=1 Tax=Luteimonas galliterrae TaxID=2940486 RepID=A0ABT0MMB7_9GAMM|nr:DUF1080 domain-containing protein [Luteimonas galliterrae]MCL1636020.1 DUF1080 domain-containing protein [Luteimonas galliterrae]